MHAAYPQPPKIYLSMKRLEDSGFWIFQEDKGCCNFLHWSVWGGTLPFFRWNGCRSRYFLKLKTVLPYGNPKRFHTFSKNWGVSNFEISFQGVMCEKKPMKLGRVPWFSKTKLLNICWISKLCPSPILPHPTLQRRSSHDVGCQILRWVRWVPPMDTISCNGKSRAWDTQGMTECRDDKRWPWWFFWLGRKTNTTEQHNLDFPFTHRVEIWAGVYQGSDLKNLCRRIAIRPIGVSYPQNSSSFLHSRELTYHISHLRKRKSIFKSTLKRGHVSSQEGNILMSPSSLPITILQGRAVKLRWYTQPVRWLPGYVCHPKLLTVTTWGEIFVVLKLSRWKSDTSGMGRKEFI